MTVELLKPYESDVGKALYKPSKLTGSNTIYIHEPAMVTLTAPEGKVMRMPSKATFINEEFGVVTNVTVLPLMQSVEFKDAFSELRRWLEKLDLKPELHMKKRIAAWSDDNWPNDESGLPHVARVGRAKVSPTAAVYVEIRPAPQRGWYLSMSFSLTSKVYDKLLDSHMSTKRRRDADDGADSSK